MQSKKSLPFSYRPFLYCLGLCGLLLGTLTGCVYQNEEDLYGVSATDCDVEAPVSYQRHVLPLLEKHQCVACHEAADPAANIILEGYEEVIPYVEDGSLYGSISYASGYDPMPKDYPRMPDCEVEVIADWIEAGAPNN